jgi:hypothetical protein
VTGGVGGIVGTSGVRDVAQDATAEAEVRSGVGGSPCGIYGGKKTLG